MEMMIDFPGGARVDAHFGPYTVSTDQPPQGGCSVVPGIPRGGLCRHPDLASQSPLDYSTQTA